MRLSFLVESLILYLAFFKTILATLFRAFGRSLSFLPSKPSFLHDHSTTQHFGFFQFLAISTTDKPVNRSIQAYALTQLNFFCVKGVYHSWYSQKKTRKEFEQFGLSNTKNKWLEHILAHAPWTRKYTDRIFESKDGTKSMKIVSYIERHNFCWNDLLTNLKSNRTEIQTFEVEERTFGTPCIYIYTRFQKGFHTERYIDRYILLFSCTCARVHFSLVIVQLVKKNRFNDKFFLHQVLFSNLSIKKECTIIVYNSLDLHSLEN